MGENFTECKRRKEILSTSRFRRTLIVGAGTRFNLCWTCITYCWVSLTNKKSIVEFIAGNNITVDRLVAVGCDGTNVYTMDETMGLSGCWRLSFTSPCSG